MTSNGYDLQNGASMYSLKKAFELSGRSIIFAIERDGCFHMISISTSGRLSILLSHDTLVPQNIGSDSSNIKHLASISTIGKPGMIVVGGKRWIKVIRLSLK